MCDFIDGEDEAEAERRMDEHVSRSIDAAGRFLAAAQARVDAEEFGFEFTDAALDWDEVLEDGALAWIRNDLDAASCALFPTERYDEIFVSEEGRDLEVEAKIQGILLAQLIPGVDDCFLTTPT